jgi:hypothetical protein
MRQLAMERKKQRVRDARPRRSGSDAELQAA